MPNAHPAPRIQASKQRATVSKLPDRVAFKVILPEHLVKKLDNIAKDLELSRNSTLICVLNQYLCS